MKVDVTVVSVVIEVENHVSLLTVVDTDVPVMMVVGAVV